MVIRNKGCYLLVTAICMAATSMPTQAYRSYGGGSGSATTARGGSASWGGGSGSASGARGGSASWGGGSGSATGAYGGSAAWSHPPAYGYHPPAYGYRPVPVPVPAYGYRPPVYYGNTGYSSGDVAAAGVAGLAVGAMVGAAAASKSAPPPATVVVQQPMNPSQMPLGTNLNNLPGGCVNINVSSTQFYQCGMNWFRPYFGSNGAYYQVVPAPY